MLVKITKKQTECTFKEETRDRTQQRREKRQMRVVRSSRNIESKRFFLLIKVLILTHICAQKHSGEFKLIVTKEHFLF